VVLLLLCPLVPESPHWLLVAGDADGAKALLRSMAALQGAKLPAGKLERAHGGSSAADSGDTGLRCWLHAGGVRRALLEEQTHWLRVEGSKGFRKHPTLLYSSGAIDIGRHG
jgi:hypothetical protein